MKLWVIEQSEKYAKDTVRLMVVVLRVMLQEAVNEGIILVNPVMKLGKFYRSAKKIKEKIDPFTIEELHQIEAKCRERFPDYYPFVLCMARTGMRIGEATALQWHDIDFEKNYIIVRRNIPHHREVQTTKTEASQRKVDMSPELSAELKRLSTERKKQAMADGKVFDAEGFVIAPAIVVFDKPGNLPLKLIRRFPHDQAYPFLAGSVIPLDLPVGLRVIGRSQDMSDPFDFEIAAKVLRQ